MDQPKYRIEIFWSEEDGGYIANVPDLRYCSAFGESYDEALREVLVAMELHLDTLRELDRPIPEPELRLQAEIGDVGYGVGLAVGSAAGQVVEEAGATAGQAAEAAQVLSEQVRESYEALVESNRAALESLAEAQREHLQISQEVSREAFQQAMEAYTEFLTSMFARYRSDLERSDKGSEASRS
jgi:predicted RNase H-like HicB family nuclease